MSTELCFVLAMLFIWLSSTVAGTERAVSANAGSGFVWHTIVSLAFAVTLLSHGPAGSCRRATYQHKSMTSVGLHRHKATVQTKMKTRQQFKQSGGSSSHVKRVGTEWYEKH